MSARQSPGTLTGVGGGVAHAVRPVEAGRQQAAQLLLLAAQLAREARGAGAGERRVGVRGAGSAVQTGQGLRKR